MTTYIAQSREDYQQGSEYEDLTDLWQARRRIG